MGQDTDLASRQVGEQLFGVAGVGHLAALELAGVDEPRRACWREKPSRAATARGDSSSSASATVTESGLPSASSSSSVLVSALSSPGVLRLTVRMVDDAIANLSHMHIHSRVAGG